MGKGRVEVKDLRPKDSVEGVYLVKHINLMDSRDGKKYLNIIFSDSTGDIEGRVWGAAEKIAKTVNKGNFAEVKGKVNFYQGRRQVVANEIKPISESDVNVDEFLPKSQFDADKMYDELLAIVSSLNDVYIKELLEKVLQDSEIQRRFKTWQAGKSIHHAYQSGLLEHVLSCTQLASQLSDHYKLNKNFVVAGAILHDICKIYELTNGASVEYTEEGKLVGHLVKGLEIVDRFSYKIKNFPYNTKLHLKHILLSHHGEYQFGSPKIPLTKEAMLVHSIDLMDSKLASFDQVINSDQMPGHWSGYVKHLDRTVFKAELPLYTEHLEEGEDSEKTRSLSGGGKPSKKKYRDKELKQNLGSLLEGFKVENDSE